MSDELFKTVKFGGYDKVEVLDFIQNKFNSLEESNNQNIRTIEDLKQEIAQLKLDVIDSDQRLATTLVENQRLVDVITHHESVLVQEYSQSQLTNAIINVSQLGEKMIKEAELKSKKMLNTSKSKAYQELSFKTNSDEILEGYENRFKKLVSNISKLSEVGSLLSESVLEVNKTLNDMLDSLPNDISEMNNE